MTTKRTSERYLYEHHVDVEFQDDHCHGEILDWSERGIQVFLDKPLIGETEYVTVFEIHRMSFVSDEELENDLLEPPVEVWSVKGSVRWLRPKKEGVAIGINFEESLDGLPLTSLQEYITVGDLCQLSIFPK